MRLLLSLLLMPFLFIQADNLSLGFDFKSEKVDSWTKTKSVDFKIENDIAVLDGSNWDSKIFRRVKLSPGKKYQAMGIGKGKLMIKLSGSKQYFCHLNLSGKDWRQGQVIFTTPDDSGNYMLFIQVQAAEGRGELKNLSFTPLSDTVSSQKLDLEKLRANHPDPPVVRGFMVGTFDERIAGIIREWGANVVRLQFSPRHRNDDNWQDSWPRILDNIEKKVKIARNHQLKVVIDLHSPPVPKGIRRDRSELWQYPDLEKNFIRIWQDIATRLKPYSDTIWGYDLYNEPLDRNQLPHAPREWRSIAVNILKAIREIDPNVWIIFEPGPGGQAGGLRNLEPLPDYKVIYSTHFYTPFEYTHQGVHNVADTDLETAMEKIGLNYPGIINGKMWDKSALNASLKTIDDFLGQYPVPYYIGEFSTIRWAPGAEQYLTDVIGLFEQRGWSWSYHAFREYHGWSLEHDEQFWKCDMPHPKRMEETNQRAKAVKSFLKKNHSD